MMFSVVFFMNGCGKPKAPSMSEEILELADLMTGSFSSEAQAKEFPDDYWDIRLEMVQIWQERKDGIWLYIEQASANNLVKPYRQRIYHLYDGPDQTFVSEVYTLPGNPLAFAGAYKDIARFKDLPADSLTIRDGCDIILKKKGPGQFEGSTEGNGCESKLGNAVYASSEVTITPEMLTSWDRGWDSDGNQAWGAEKGAYKFEKIKDYPLVTLKSK